MATEESAFDQDIPYPAPPDATLLATPRPPVRWRRVWQRALAFVLPPAASDVAERNIWDLRVMLIWAGVLSAAASFNSNFAVRLGASNQLIGLMSSIPALIVVLTTLPAARFLESRSKRLPWVAGSLALHRVAYLLIALMPFLVQRYQAEVFIGIIFAAQIVLAPFHAGWDSVLADVIPERRRATVMAQRNMLLSGTVIVAVALMGRVLDRMVFPYGYQLVYGVGFLISCLGSWQVWRLRIPDAPVPVRSETKRPRLALSQVRELLAKNDDYVRIVLNTFMLDIGAWLIAPLYIILYLRHLGASDSWVGTLTAVANFSAMGGYYIWQKIINRWGESRILRRLSPTVGFFPLWVAAWQSLPLIMVAAVINNLLMPGINLSHYNTLIKVCPPEHRPSYISLYSVIMNVGAFVAPMLGVALADRFGVVPMLVVGGVLRVLGALLFTFRPVRVRDSVA